MPERPSFLTANVDVLFVGGKGGVGKTTVATATALERSRTRPVRLLSTDPAHSIADSLAIDDAGLPADRHLTIEELDAEAELTVFRAAHRDTLHEIIDRGTLFDSASIQRLLDLALPGMDAVMAFLRLAELAAPKRTASSADELLVVDTAPTGHTLRLLDTPDQFERWVGFLDVLLEKHRTMRAVFAGASEPDEFDRFVEEMQEKTKRVRSLLRNSDRCRFVVVTQAEPVVWTETDRLLRELHDRSIPVREVVVNRWSPSRPRLSGVLSRIDDALTERSLSGWTLPEEATELRGLDSLTGIWERVRPLPSPTDAGPTEDTDVTEDTGPAGEKKAGARAETASSRRSPPVVRQSLPAPEQDLVMVAGKGGVGKTTTACALALARAETASEDRPVLLASTDPAHSLSTALAVDLTDEPTPVAPGLEAVEIDAPARFERLRATYGEEVRAFFRETGGPSVDLMHDRRVTEALMDLAPPGIDEVMGWTAAMEFLQENRYDTCVLDTAPTGHFLQLLEMPAIFQEWIRTFFRILRNHRHVVRLPDLVDRLVRLSKQVKAVRSMLRDGSAGILGVTIPTRMALAELQDLDRTATEQETPIAALVLNRMAPADAPAKRRDEQAAILSSYRTAFPERPIALIAEGRPPRGTTDLRRLGQHAFDLHR